MINYISTRGGGPKSFEEVLLEGLAPDGGLYVPKSWPQIDLAALKGKSYVEVAEAVMFPFVEGSIERADFRGILEETYSAEIFRHPDVVPLHKLNDDLYVLELFYGPTIAFKDVALQLLGRLFDYVLSKRGERVTIVGATSGDTGSAAIEGCRHSDHVDIFILHPKGRVSDVQRKQMTSVNAPNVHNIALDGTFDDCQSMVKAMFNDPAFRSEMNLSAVNSINWARIMAQIVYYVSVTLALDDEVSFVVPTGNFGNVFAAYAALQMGLPIKSLTVATNANDILTRFFESGEMVAKDVHPTLSPSMDIQISSNFERYLFDALGRDAEKLNAFMNEFRDSGKFSLSDSLIDGGGDLTAYRLDDEGTLEVIKKIHDETGYVLDPHSAVGMAAALKIVGEVERDGPVVTLATAHPAKFPDAVEKAIGERPKLPDHLSDLMDREEFVTDQPNDLKAVQDFVRSNV
ncbi:MAG: threonine synthase [Micavibrio sp.]|nr:MAG: threonine synthase [Micavibrio sp.]